jgi:hypothetical protein
VLNTEVKNYCNISKPGDDAPCLGIKKIPVVPVPDDPIFSADPIIFSTRLTYRPYFLQVVAGCSYSVPKWRLLSH